MLTLHLLPHTPLLTPHHLPSLSSSHSPPLVVYLHARSLIVLIHSIVSSPPIVSSDFASFHPSVHSPFSLHFSLSPLSFALVLSLYISLSLPHRLPRIFYTWSLSPSLTRAHTTSLVANDYNTKNTNSTSTSSDISSSRCRSRFRIRIEN